jgi:ankyrin repeat protein
VIKSLIRHGENVNATGGFFGTGLQAAAPQGHLEAMETLLEHGADPNVVWNGHCGTALASDIGLKLDKVTLLLIQNRAGSKIVNDHGWSPKTWTVLQDWIPPNASLEINQQYKLPSKLPSKWNS